VREKQPRDIADKGDTNFWEGAKGKETREVLGERSKRGRRRRRGQGGKRGKREIGGHQSQGGVQSERDI
jgi:hypothetical protein